MFAVIAHVMAAVIRWLGLVLMPFLLRRRRWFVPLMLRHRRR
jgi:hypothetical protein